MEMNSKLMPSIEGLFPRERVSREGNLPCWKRKLPIFGEEVENGYRLKYNEDFLPYV